MKPIILDIFNALTERGWVALEDPPGHWRHPDVPGRSFPTMEAVVAQTFKEIAEEVVEERG